MAAAHTLAQRGIQVTVLEVSHHVGGRARGVDDPHLGDIDNGQHLLIGAYRSCVALMDRAGKANRNQNSYQRLPLRLVSANGGLSIQMEQTYAPRWQRLVAFLKAKGLTIMDRCQAIYLLAGLHCHLLDPKPGQTVQQWLLGCRQGKKLQQLLWNPLCIATMNTDPTRACARLFARVIRDSLLSQEPGAVDLLVPLCNLSDLWINPLSDNISILFGTSVSEVNPPGTKQNPNQSQVEVLGKFYDGCIIATPATATVRIVSKWPGKDACTLCRQLESFEFLPITTCYVELDRYFPLPYPMIMLSSGHQDNDPTYPGQWVFERHWASRKDDIQHQHTQLAFVISHAKPDLVLDRNKLPETLVRQLVQEMATEQDIPGIRHSRTITEKRATFAAVPDLPRPSNHSPWSTIKLAGDWTDTGYPAVLEGAVSSGEAAANALLQEIQF